MNPATLCCMNWSIRALLLVSCLAMNVEARSVRRMFEPTDLEWEAPGESEMDVQLGLIRGPDSYRLTVPDFEVDVGLTRQIELDFGEGSFT